MTITYVEPVDWMDAAMALVEQAEQQRAIEALLTEPAVPSGDTRPTEQWTYLAPIGPAPEGWHRLPDCCAVIPHNRAYRPDQDTEMNEDHYR